MIRCRGHMTRRKTTPFSRRGLIYVRLWGFFLNALLLTSHGIKRTRAHEALQILATPGIRGACRTFIPDVISSSTCGMGIVIGNITLLIKMQKLSSRRDQVDCRR
jgi:hypothetical protein